MKATISFTLDTEADADLLDWMNRHSGTRRRSIAIRDALRRGIGTRDDVSNAEVLQAVQALARKIGRGVVIGSEGQQRPPESPRAAANLDKLGL